ncbi:MAG: KamA family radical SAM protein [Nitrososphaerota archaeon]|nr:KamA family radical SAM protein [Nitrososphaerales archaeon]MDW8044562.1 KamA family radical SAM protein [Nitrososphaerota archaeon]
MSGGYNKSIYVPPEKVARDFGVSLDEIKAVIKKYPMRVTTHYYSLIEEVGDPIWKQCIPDIKELYDPYGEEDPLKEERDSPIPWLTHRYPDRLLMCVSNECATYCRFCTRKRRIGDLCKISDRVLIEQINYVKEHREVRDVLISGGDPFMLPDEHLEFILSKLRKIEHVEILRIGTRIPCTLPSRVTEKLVNMLKKYHPLYVNIHFNHPREVNEESARACGLLADAGIPLGSQTVLLRGVNDDPSTMKLLMQKLLTIRVRPYYLFQADPVKGTYHFRTTVEQGLKIMQELIGHTSGLAIPHYVIDAPGGGGKVPILPNYLESISKEKVVIRNYQGKLFEYIQPQLDSELQP